MNWEETVTETKCSKCKTDVTKCDCTSENAAWLRVTHRGKKAQAKITWDKAIKEGRKKVAEWVEANALEVLPEGTSITLTELSISKKDWQTQLKIWFRDNSKLLKKWRIE